MFNFSSQLQNLRSSIIGIVLIVAMAVIGLTWISIGIHSYFTSLVGPVWGPIVLGGLFFLPIVIFALVRSMDKNDARAQTPSYANPFNDAVGLNIPKLIESLSGHSPFFVTVVAITAGFLATRFPALLVVFSQVITAYADDYKIRTARAAAEKEEMKI